MTVQHIKIIIFLLITFHPEPILADLDMNILPGFDGYQKYDRWLPLRITLSSTGETVEGEVIAKTQDNLKYSVPVTIFGTAKKVEYLYVTPEKFRRNLDISLIDKNGKEILQRNVPLTTISPEDVLIITVDRNKDSKLNILESGLFVSNSTVEFLPDNWKGFDSVDVLILGDVSSDSFSTDQKKALIDWIYSGGVLVVSGGANSRDISGTFIERLLPVRIDGTRVLDTLGEDSPNTPNPFLGEDSPKNQSGYHVGKIVVASSKLIEGGKSIFSADNGLPIIAEKKAGAGKVIFLSYNYLDPAIRSWKGNKDLWRKLLPKPSAHGTDRHADIIRLLYANRHLSLPSYKLVGVFLLFYVVSFGTINFILKRKGKSEWMWLTMPAIALVFIFGAMGFNYTRSGESTVINDLSVVNIYQEIKRARINSYFSVFSSIRHGFNISFPGSDGIFVSQIPSQDSEPGNEEFKLAEKDVFSLEIPRIKASSPQLLYGESCADFNGYVSYKTDGSANGNLVSNLPFDLFNCCVIANGCYAQAGDLNSGANLKITINNAFSGDILDIYKDTEKQRFIKTVKQSIQALGKLEQKSIFIPDKALIGWMNESALRILSGMDTGKNYKSSGMALVIIYL